MNKYLRRRPFFDLVLTLSFFLLLPAGPNFRAFLGHEDHEHGLVEAAEAAETKQLYTCSMHPFIIRDAPGKCPICFMDLVPVRDQEGRREEDGEGNIITIDPVTRQNMGVRTAPVTRRDLHRTVRTVGLVAYPESAQYTVNAKIDGWIETLHVSRSGESVASGQPLLEIYSPELVSAQEEFLLAVRQSKTLAASPFPEIAAGARGLLSASRQRLRYWDITPAQIAALEESGTISKTLTLYASQAGIVTRKAVKEGAFVKAGQELLELSDLSRVWIYADIYEYELPWVKEGQQVTIDFPYPRAPLSGKIAAIYPYMEAKTRTVKARIEVANRDAALKPDMYVTVNIAGEGADQALTVPAEAVLRSGRQETVFVALGEGRFDPRRVSLGLETDDGLVQILDGLHEGEMVVTSAQFMLDSESRLREAVSKMIAAETPAAAAAAQPAGDAELDDLFN
ncbi:MAG: efflux RND transporter periplasmic adaptor subunit [Elusimicrobiales bacterium]|nr:efflux RND transporter periplasmic adaptor subunit [Elusimicrobiales bacterium]